MQVFNKPYCLKDFSTDLPTDSSTVFVRIPQPKTNVNWYDNVKSNPPWAKQLEHELGIGKTLVRESNFVIW